VAPITVPTPGSRSLHFGGSGPAAPTADRVLVPVDPPTAADLGATDFTIELWLAATAADNPAAAVTCDVPDYTWLHGATFLDRDRWPLISPDGRDFGASVTSDGRIAFGVQNAAGAAWTTCTSGVNVLDGAWHHIALERATTGLLQVWVDGVLRAQANGPAGDVSYPDGAATSRPGTDPYLVLGASKLGIAALPSFRGYLDEVRLSTIIRYRSPFFRPTGPFVPDAWTAALYHFDGGTGSCSVALADAAGHVNATCVAAPGGPTFSTLVPAFHGIAIPQAVPGPNPGTTSFAPMTPLRLVDTRPSALAAHQVLEVQVTGRGGIPAEAVSAALNVTAVSPSGTGYLTVWPCGQAMPGTSNLNFTANETVANFAQAAIGAGGRICVASPVRTDVVIDVTGWWSAGGLGYGAVLPTRLTDTRPNRVIPGQPLVVQVTGRAGIPASAWAASVNITATSTLGQGWVTVWPCGWREPDASTLNFAAGQTIANSAAVALGAGGRLCMAASASAALVVDVTGWWGPAGLAHANPPSPSVRLLDTRGHGALAPNQVVAVQVPPAAGVATLDLTVVGPAAPGWLTVWPCGQAPPSTSNLSFGTRQTLAATAMVPPGPDGTVCLRASAPTNLLVDLFGSQQVSAVAQQALGGRLYAIQWGFTQLGTDYAPVNPYRFGDSIWGRPWDCPSGWTSCARVDIIGKLRAAEAGEWVYDCSGFVVAAFLQAGIDLVRLNAGWSDAMYAALPRVPAAQIQTGDLLLFGPGAADPSDPTTHVAIYLGANRLLDASTGCANGTVCERAVDWTRVTVIARPPYPGAVGPSQSAPTTVEDPYSHIE
jgi:hypothetical protein